MRGSFPPETIEFFYFRISFVKRRKRKKWKRKANNKKKKKQTLLELDGKLNLLLLWFGLGSGEILAWLVWVVWVFWVVLVVVFTIGV